MIEGWGLAAAAVGAAGAVAGAEISSSGAKSAANTAAAAQQAGANTQLQMFNTTQQDYAPQILLGQNAATKLEHLSGAIGGKPDYSGFENSPNYLFSLNQGESAINKNAAASGNLYSTQTLGALNNFAQGTASQQYNSYVNQLLTMAGLGNAAASGVGTAATATGQGVANSLGNAGNAQANGILGQSNAFSNALGQFTNGGGGNNLMSAMNNPANSDPNYYNPNAGAASGSPLYDGSGNIIGYTP